jgi:hypothetical protein
MILLRVIMKKKKEKSIIGYFPMRPPIVSLGLLGDNRTQDKGGTIVDSKKDKDRATIVRRKRGQEKKKNRVITLNMMISGLLWALLLLSFKEDGLRAAKLNPSSLEKQRRFSLRLPCFFMPKETGKGYVTGNLCGF